jgi:hypothetical protein
MRRIHLDLSDVFSGELIKRGCEVISAARDPSDLLALPFAKLL